jgi:hypothetical protein
LNKGCYFVIYVENFLCYKNGNDKPPKHKDLLDDLKAKKQSLSKKDYVLLMNSVEKIYNLQSAKDAISLTKKLPTQGWNYELLLKLLRWFFIEQDITYWAKSGRDMLYSVIKKI